MVRKRLPIYIEMKTIARVLNQNALEGEKWSTERARRWCIRTEIAVKRGGRWMATQDGLRREFPEVWQRMVEMQMAAAEANRARRNREAIDSALARARGAQ